MAPLDEYRRKRDFERTPEPSGATESRDRQDEGVFVVQKHAATRLHFDLRLEQDGVLKSWAVPKGPSLEPGEKRLAVQVEDHPLEYGEFEGIIPEGEYGGGTVMLWDRGVWRPAGKVTEDHIDFELEGSKLRGFWTLVRMRGRSNDEGENWLLIKRSDDWAVEQGAIARKQGKGKKTGVTQSRRQRADRSQDSGAEAGNSGSKGSTGKLLRPSADDRSVASGRSMKQIAADADSTWTPQGRVGGEAEPPQPGALEGAREGELPREPRPQLATLVDEAPTGEEWIHEIKFDGYRILARIDEDDEERPVRLLSRNGKDWTDRFGNIALLLENLPCSRALLDGEVVAFSGDGSSSFRRLQESLSEERTDDLVYQVFDLLHLDGVDLTRSPQLERKRALERLLRAAAMGASGNLRYTDHIQGKGPAFYRQACGLGLEGIISKRGDAAYRSGRGRTWLKVKCSRNEELLIGGYTEPGGSRVGFGALLLGAYDEQGRLAYAGKVGTGFSDSQLKELHRRLQELEVKEPPFDPAPPRRGVHWVTPRLVAQVEFTEWTRDNSLRHPTFRGLREDKDPEEIRMPSTEATGKKAGAAGSAAGKRAAGGKAVGSGGSEEAKDRPERKGRKRASAPKLKRGEAQVAGVRLTSPERVLYPEQGVTKLALARYYEEIADWILPHVQNRPLSLVRCPEGHTKQCFFQKHPKDSMAKGVERVIIEESDGPEPYLYIQELPDIIELVQAGVLELHVWGSKQDDLERPDILVFDLDPAADVPWKEMLRVAKELRDRLEELGLASFPRTTGGKGLHLVVPLIPRLDWEAVKEFAQAVANAHAQDDRSRITTNMSKAKRRGKIFLDYLRNGRGATAIASYSTRSREGAPVAVPVRWDEVNSALRPDRYRIDNLRRRLSALSGDPWEGFEEARRPIDDGMLAAVGLD